MDLPSTCAWPWMIIASVTPDSAQFWLFANERRRVLRNHQFLVRWDDPNGHTFNGVIDKEIVDLTNRAIAGIGPPMMPST